MSAKAARRRRQIESVPRSEELARLWSAPDPELTNHGFAVEPEYLQQRLQDPAYAQRYPERLGGPPVPKALEVPDVATEAA